MRKEQGFTLIELVMVIVIIGILAAVALPRFANLRNDAQQAACDGNAGAIRGALAAYYAKTAVSPGWTGGETTQGWPGSLTDANYIACFISGTTIPNCPRDGNSTYYENNYNNTTGVLLDHTH